MKKMKQLLALICAAGIIVSQCVNALAIDSGSGTVSDPYKISSELDFMEIKYNPSGNYVLTRDISVKNVLEDVDFNGILDGNGHRIDSIANLPLFSTVSGTVKNLAVSTNVRNGEGILANTLTGDVSQSMFLGFVNASYDRTAAGGIAGTIEKGTVTDCIINVKISSSAENSGALAGKITDSKISNCYVGGQVSRNRGVAAAVIGTAENSDVSGTYYDSSKTDLPYGICVGSDTTTALKKDSINNSSSYPTFDFGSTWTIIEGQTEPMLVVHNGLGTQANPYKIHTVDEFGKILSDDADKYYKVENDINLSSSWGDAEEQFKGHFDGGNHKITGAQILFKIIGEGAVVENVTRGVSSNYALTSGGITSVNYGLIRNCYVYGNVSSTKDCGGIAGENLGGTIQDCYFNGSVSVSQTGGGGIVGYNSYGTIENCGAVVSITGKDHSIGGIAGDNSNGTIKNCYAKGSLSKGTEVGGIAGRLYNGSIISSYSDCSLSGTSDIGGIYGLQIENGYVENSYYTIKNNQNINSDQEASYGREEARMKTQSTYNGFDFNNIWAIDEGRDTPVLRNVNGAGTKNQPYIIRTQDEFLAMKSNRRLYYELGNNISTYNHKGVFTGSFNGKGHTIHLGNNGPAFDELGEGAYVGNVHAEGGIIALSATGATIEYCTLGRGISDAPRNLVRTLNNSTVRNCKIVGANSSSNGSISGVLAQTAVNSTISNCAVVDSSVNVSDVAGGFVGTISGTTINNCFTYNTDVSGSLAGGFVGRNDGNSAINNSSSYGNVSGTTYTGAFAGMNYASISSSYGIVPEEEKSAEDSEIAEEHEKIEFAGYNTGTLTSCKTEYDGSLYKLIPTGGVGTTVSVPDLKAEEAVSTVVAVTLSDISGHWAEATIKKLVAEKVISGYEDGTYRPQNSVTKAEFIKLLLAANKNSIKDGFTSYEDVNKHWAKNYINTAILLKICDNINKSSSVFGADDAITRYEAVALMGRLVTDGNGGTVDFTDADSIPDWAYSSVASCVSLGLINGMGDGTFAPNNNLTRAESAVIIERVMALK